MTEPTQKPRWYTTFWAQLAGAIAGGGLLFGAIILVDLLDKPHALDGTDAGLACQEFVKGRLKSPSSADFSNVRHEGESPRWTVTGSVDAENSFGASLRSNWTCTVRLDGGEFVLESLAGL